MIDWLRFGLSALLTGIGLFTLISAVLGTFRFRYALSRLHAAALADTLGALSIAAGLALAEGFTPTSLKLLAVVVFLWLTSPVSSHLIARLEVTINDTLAQDMRVEDSAYVRQEKDGDEEDAG